MDPFLLLGNRRSGLFDIERTTYSANREEVMKSNTPRYLVKADWTLNDKNLLELTALKRGGLDVSVDEFDPRDPLHEAVGAVKVTVR